MGSRSAERTAADKKALRGSQDPLRPTAQSPTQHCAREQGEAWDGNVGIGRRSRTFGRAEALGGPQRMLGVRCDAWAGPRPRYTGTGAHGVFLEDGIGGNGWRAARGRAASRRGAERSLRTPRAAPSPAGSPESRAAPADRKVKALGGRAGGVRGRGGQRWRDPQYRYEYCRNIDSCLGS